MGYPRAVHYAAAIAVAAVVPSAPAHADYTGNDVLKDCSVGATWSTGACFGRVIGAVKGVQLMASLSGQPAPFCMRDNVTNGQVVDVVTVWLRAHPSERDLDSEVVTSLALRDAFPCAKK